MDLDEDDENTSKKNKRSKCKSKKKESSGDINDIKTLKDKTEAIIAKTNEIMDLSSRYYELIPKENSKIDAYYLLID